MAGLGRRHQWSAAGEQGEQVTKGYFSVSEAGGDGSWARVATLYEELVVDCLYSGKIQLEKSFQQLVNWPKRCWIWRPPNGSAPFCASTPAPARTAYQLGSGARIRHLTKQELETSLQADAIDRTVYDDPRLRIASLPGWQSPTYVRATRQLAVRRKDKKGPGKCASW